MQGFLWSPRQQAEAQDPHIFADRMRCIGASVETADGAVKVVVGPDGVPTALALSPDVLTWTSDRIAAQIMDTLRLAHERVVAEIIDLTEATYGPDSPTTRAILHELRLKYPGS